MSIKIDPEKGLTRDNIFDYIALWSKLIFWCGFWVFMVLVGCKRLKAAMTEAVETAPWNLT